jgi:molecular chaperone DnaK
MKARYECGIDLGTTNSCVAIINDSNECEIIENNTDRMNVTPSAVQVSKTGRITVGQHAYNYPDGRYVKKEFKRDMGTDQVYSFPQSEKRFTAIELSSEVLKSMKRDVEARLNRRITSAVITVPAAFQELQIKATKEAAKMSGFQNVILLQEPVAAAVAYGANADNAAGNWLVFDYGGGTLDVAVVSTSLGQIEVINNKGNNRMGGKDLDKAVYTKIVLPKLQKEYQIADTPSSRVRAKALLEIEKCKIALSNQDSYTFELFDLMDDVGEEIDFGLEITREQFEEAIDSIVEETIDIARDALTEISLTEKDINKIVLVGGSTFVPLVRTKLQEEFHVDLDCSLNPMTVVAKGAAMYANETTYECDNLDEVEHSNEDIIVELQYDNTTVKDTVTIVGRFHNYSEGMVNRIMLSSEDGELWHGGWNELLDAQNGVFSYDVSIYNHDGLNSYRMTAIDATGAEVSLLIPEISVTYGGGLRLAAPPLPFNIGVMTSDGYGNIVDWLLKKNTRLPSTNSGIYRLNKRLDPKVNDVFTLQVYEGENAFNPTANHLIGTINVNSIDLPQALSEGEEIEITLDVDISRVVTVTAYIPKLDYTLTEEQIMGNTVQYQSVNADLKSVSQEMIDIEERIERLKASSIDVEVLSEDLNRIRAKVANGSSLPTDNDEAQQLLEEYHNLESSVIQKERTTSDSIGEKKDLETLSFYERMIAQYGTENDRRDCEFYKEKFLKETQPEFKKHFLSTIGALKQRVCWNSFIWLKEQYYYYKEHDSLKYTNAQQAKYWIDQAYQNVIAENQVGLKECIREIIRLRDYGSEDTAKQMTEIADIRLL